jgi:hypothetical protein
MPEKNYLKHAAMQIVAGGSAGKSVRFTTCPIPFREFRSFFHLIFFLHETHITDCIFSI